MPADCISIAIQTLDIWQHESSLLGVVLGPGEVAEDCPSPLLQIIIPKPKTTDLDTSRCNDCSVSWHLSLQS